jgi:hypothetical protein
MLALLSRICIFAFSFIVVACQTQALGLLRYDFLGGHPYIMSTKIKGGLVSSEHSHGKTHNIPGKQVLVRS